MLAGDGGTGGPISRPGTEREGTRERGEWKNWRKIIDTGKNDVGEQEKDEDDVIKGQRWMEG